MKSPRRNYIVNNPSCEVKVNIEQHSVENKLKIKQHKKLGVRNYRDHAGTDNELQVKLEKALDELST